MRLQIFGRQDRLEYDRNSASRTDVGSNLMVLALTIEKRSSEVSGSKLHDVKRYTYDYRVKSSIQCDICSCQIVTDDVRSRNELRV